jgi:hypothetical protein
MAMRWSGAGAPSGTVQRTWDLSLDALAASRRPQARSLLFLLSCYSPAILIPAEMLRPQRLFGRTDHPDLYAARVVLPSAGLRTERRLHARRLRPRRWRCVTGAADRRRRDRRLCPCQLRAGELCAVRGKAPLVICSGAASRRGLPYGGSARFYGGSTRWQGHLGRFTGLRLRCGDWRAAAGGCHCASLMMKRRAAAAAVRPCVRPGPGSRPSSFPQVTHLERSGGPVLPPLFAGGMRPGRPLPC